MGIAAVALLSAAAPISAARRPVARAGSQAAAPAERIITDDMGRRVAMPTQVNRIVTLAPNLTEIVYALGLEDRLAGDTNECDAPIAAKSKPHVGDMQNPNLEAIVALHPDVVLATTSINRVDTADSLMRLGIPVYTTDGEFRTVLGMLDSIGRMADLIGAKAQGTDLVAGLRARLDALHARLEDRPMAHVLFVVWPDPLLSVGQNVFIADALRWAGAESVVLSKQNWPRLSMEEVVRLQPEYIVIESDHSQSGGAELADLRSRSGWRDLDAVITGRVIEVSEEAIRPSPGLVDEIEKLARKVHPEAFSETTENRNSKYEARVEIDAAAKFAGGCVQCAR